MDFVNLRRAGGSLTLTVPSRLAKTLGLTEGSRMSVTAEAGRLIAQPTTAPAPVYTLDELLEQCDPTIEMSEDERLWLDAPPAGREII